MEKEQILTYGVKLQKIEIEQFAIIEEVLNDASKVRFSYDFSFGVERTDSVIGSFVTFDFLTETSVFLKLSIACFYKVHPESWTHLVSQPGPLTLPVSLLRTLAEATVGTARGILYAKTERSDYNRFLIPMMMMSEIIHKPLRVEDKK